MQQDSVFHDHPIILFDGICNLCNKVVQFVIRHDHKAKFRFGSLQSAAAQKLIAGIDTGLGHIDSIILVTNGKAYTKSAAAIKIMQMLGGIFKLSSVFMLLPEFFRDGVYDVIARNRYKIFGKRDTCMIPTAELQNRFIS